MKKKIKNISNGVNKKLVRELKEKLEKEKSQIEEELKKFAKKDEKLKGDWDTIFPRWDGTASGGGRLETAADEVDEYSTLLPIEHNLELKLRDINLALEKIEHPRRGYPKYGICEKCGKEIEIGRLKTIPETRSCLKCKAP